MQFLRTQLHLRMRTMTFEAAMRLRSALTLITHEFFQARGFLHVDTPNMTTSDTEGAGEMFQVVALYVYDTQNRVALLQRQRHSVITGCKHQGLPPCAMHDNVLYGRLLCHVYMVPLLSHSIAGLHAASHLCKIPLWQALAA